MANRDPIAFLSYVHSDDEHDDNRISKLRRSLEGEVKMQTGKPFHIFQDRNDLLWGQQWQERIKETLSELLF
jgi:cobaltochelatase CobT